MNYMETNNPMHPSANRSTADHHSFQAVVVQHIPLVQKMARRVAANASAHIAYDDLFSAGTLGLINSVIRNRGGEPRSFISYIKIRVLGAMYDELRASRWRPRQSPNGRRAASLSHASQPDTIVLLEDLGGTPTWQPHHPNPTPDPHEVLSRKQTRRTLYKALSTLPARDQLILQLHYFKGMKMREIGGFLGISEGRVSQIHHRALARVRPYMQNTAPPPCPQAHSAPTAVSN